jgi:hypothetical protein
MTDLVRIPAIAPIELVRLPAELDGQAGINRATSGRSQIAAQNDIDAVKAWLARFADTLTTFTSYRKEAERLLLWSVIEVGKPLSSLTHEYLLIYQRFLGDPQPAERWVMKAGRKWSRFEPDWRPFAGPLAATSQRQAIVILNTLFSWLVNAGVPRGQSVVVVTSAPTEGQATDYPVSGRRALAGGQGVHRGNVPGNVSGARALLSGAVAVFAALHMRAAHFGGHRQFHGRLLLPPRQGRRGALVAGSDRQGRQDADRSSNK